MGLRGPGFVCVSWVAFAEGGLYHGKLYPPSCLLQRRKMVELKTENVLLVASNANLRGMIKQQEAPPPYLLID